MLNVATVIAIVGGIAFIVGLFGGGIKLKEVQIPVIPAPLRFLSIIAGGILIGIAVWFPTSPATPSLLTSTKIPNTPTPEPTEIPTPVPSADKPTVSSQYRVLLDTYHGGETLSSVEETLLQNKGFQFENATGPFTANLLSNYDVLVIWLPQYSDGQTRFIDDELIAIRDYVYEGGSAFLIGLGWVWTDYQKESIEEYPLNIIVDGSGIYFTDAHIVSNGNDGDNETPVTFYSPFINEHPITQNVNKVRAKEKAVPGSLMVESPAIPIIFGDDNTKDTQGVKNPVILAVTTLGDGKIVALQHNKYVKLSDEFDNFQLLENVLMWLVRE